MTSRSSWYVRRQISSTRGWYVYLSITLDYEKKNDGNTKKNERNPSGPTTDKKRSKEEWIGRVEGIRRAKLSIRVRHGSYVIQ